MERLKGLGIVVPLWAFSCNKSVTIRNKVSLWVKTVAYVKSKALRNPFSFISHLVQEPEENTAKRGQKLFSTLIIVRRWLVGVTVRSYYTIRVTPLNLVCIYMNALAEQLTGTSLEIFDQIRKCWQISFYLPSQVWVANGQYGLFKEKSKMTKKNQDKNRWASLSIQGLWH